MHDPQLANILNARAAPPTLILPRKGGGNHKDPHSQACLFPPPLRGRVRVGGYPASPEKLWVMQSALRGNGQ